MRSLASFCCISAEPFADAAGGGQLGARHVARGFLHIFFELFDVGRHLVFLIRQFLGLLARLRILLTRPLAAIVEELFAESLAQAIGEITLLRGELIGAIRTDRPTARMPAAGAFRSTSPALP